MLSVGGMLVQKSAGDNKEMRLKIVREYSGSPVLLLARKRDWLRWH